MSFLKWLDPRRIVSLLNRLEALCERGEAMLHIHPTDPRHKPSDLYRPR